jgi:hypothetical protein
MTCPRTVSADSADGQKFVSPNVVERTYNLLNNIII